MPPVRVLISALSAKSYGGDSYFRSLLPALSRAAGRVECDLVVSDGRFDSLCPPGGVVRIIHTPVPPIARGPARVLWEQALLPWLARRHAASVIYTPSNAGVIIPGIPRVIAVRNMEPLVPPQAGASAALRARHAMLAAFTKASARSASRVIAVSGAVRDAVLLLGVDTDRIDVIYHGVDDLPRPDPDKPRQGGFMAAAAKFVRYANLETMISAFREVRERGYAGKLLVAGGPYDEQYERDIRRQVAAFGLEGAVQFLGYRPRSEILELMGNSDAFFFPSMLEACPFTLLEAMSQGAAVVATTCPPMPEFASEGAALIEPRDVAGFASAAWRFVTDPDVASDQRRRARERAATFVWSDTVDRLIECWTKAAGSRGTPDVNPAMG